MNRDIDYYLSLNDRHQNRERAKISRAQNVMARLENSKQFLLKVKAINPNIMISSHHATAKELFWKDIPIEGRYITYGKGDLSIYYAEYGSMIVDGKKHRVYKTEPIKLCYFENRYDYSLRNYQINITINKSNAWEDPVCASKIKSIYKRFFNKCIGRVRDFKKEDVIYKGLENAPTYIKMINNFK